MISWPLTAYAGNESRCDQAARSQRGSILALSVDSLGSLAVGGGRWPGPGLETPGLGSCEETRVCERKSKRSSTRASLQKQNTQGEEEDSRPVPPKVSKTVLGTFRLGCLWTSQLRAVRSQSVAVPKRLLQRASGAHVDPRPHFLSLRLSCRNRRCLHPCCKIQAWAASAAHDKATGHRLFPESLIWPEHQLALIKITSLLRGSQTQSGASHEARPTS